MPSTEKVSPDGLVPTITWARFVKEEIQSRSLAWSVGWGIHSHPSGISFFHVGAEPGCENYAVYFTAHKTGYVLLSAGGEFNGVVRYVAPKLIGDRISPFDWLGY